MQIRGSKSNETNLLGLIWGQILQNSFLNSELHLYTLIRLENQKTIKNIFIKNYLSSLSKSAMPINLWISTGINTHDSTDKMAEKRDSIRWKYCNKLVLFLYSSWSPDCCLRMGSWWWAGWIFGLIWSNPVSLKYFL